MSSSLPFCSVDAVQYIGDSSVVGGEEFGVITSSVFNIIYFKFV